MVAPEAGAVVDTAVGGKLLDGVHPPAARRALLRGAAPRPRHPLAVAALLLRRARDREAKDRGGRREGGRKRRRRWMGWMIGECGNGRRLERAAQLRRACGAGREAWDWENSGSADGELVRSEVCTPACFCQKRSELLRAPTQATYRNFRDTPMPVRLLMAQHARN